MLHQNIRELWPGAPTRARGLPACGNGRSLLSVVRTLALHQASFGVPYPKPTLLVIATGELPRFCYEGPPTYDPDGYYTGPLPLLEAQDSGENGLADILDGQPLQLKLLRRGPGSCRRPG